MEDINVYTGAKIRNYRKMKNLTLQQLADAIHKSRATVSKYENGEITLDIETLFEISRALDVTMSQLTDYRPEQADDSGEIDTGYNGQSAFFKADKLYFYYYDGRYNRLKESVIHIHKKSRDENGCYDSSLTMRSTSSTGFSSEAYYTGSVLYSDMLIRFSFVNQYNKLEQDLLYIFNPLEERPFTEGLLCGISSTDLKPCAFKCLVTLSPAENYEIIKEQLMLTAKEFRRWKKINMFIVDNNSETII